MFLCQDLIYLFNQLFKESEKTLLVGGGVEPLYLPISSDCLWHQIIFTQDYYASALHEIAHWCIASEQRRQLVDYGYWYHPDGRNLEDQLRFEQAEIKPQALEWIFSAAVGIAFNISADNLAFPDHCIQGFKKDVYKQVMHYLRTGLPIRALRFKNALTDYYDRASIFNEALFMVS